MSNTLIRFVLVPGLTILLGGSVMAEDTPWVVFEGKDGPGQGKHIVFVTGDEEYRSEESMPQMAKILAEHHGFKCTVLFAIDKQTGEINPKQLDNIPGLESLKAADLMVLFVRFRNLPKEQMEMFLDYVRSGKPIVALRTSTHAFAVPGDGPYGQFDWRSKAEGWQGGFGRQILGETWVSHYGRHQVESTRGLPAEGQEDHPILKGITDIWGPSDVYGLTTLVGEPTPVVMGQVLEGMKPEDKPKEGKNLVPIAWTRSYSFEDSPEGRVFVTTMGHGGDFQNEGVRRMLVNACYWALGMEEQIPDESKVDLVGEYEPNPIGVGGHKTGLKPSDHQIK